ncbi:uncharacterized protein LOC8033155 [Ixodes scapularis]|uniref:uncharacterized protein LOC8033155 n=1 Tax=Ixodes scapularis TaxID=6945 RepID=UPI001C38876E|nr:uncharacterized protein LOC8033155 [Ixodes scapularis]
MSEDFNVRLCTLVGKHPAIYDMFDVNFREESVKKEAWMAISRELGVPDSKCIIKWKGIKHRYVSCRRDEDTSWELLPYLGFLDEVGIKSKVQKRKRESILPASGRAEGSATTTSDQECRPMVPIIERFVATTSIPSQRKSTRFVGETKGAYKPEDLPIVEPDDTELVLVRVKKSPQGSLRPQDIEKASRPQPDFETVSEPESAKPASSPVKRTPRGRKSLRSKGTERELPSDLEPVSEPESAKPASSPVKRTPRGRKSTRFARETSEPVGEPESTTSVLTPVKAVRQTEVFRFQAQAKATSKPPETPAAELEDTELVLVRVKKTEQGNVRFVGEIELADKPVQNPNPVWEPEIAKPISTPAKNTPRGKRILSRTVGAKEAAPPQSMEVDDLPVSEPSAKKLRIEANGGTEKSKDVFSLTERDERFIECLRGKLAQVALENRGPIEATLLEVMDRALK